MSNTRGGAPPISATRAPGGSRERLVSNRKPHDLPAFCAKFIEEFGEGRHEVASAGATASVVGS